MKFKAHFACTAQHNKKGQLKASLSKIYLYEEQKTLNLPNLKPIDTKKVASTCERTWRNASEARRVAPHSVGAHRLWRWNSPVS